MTTKCKGNCQTFIGNASTGAVQCADCGAKPKAIAPSTFPQWGSCTPSDPTDELGKVWDVLHAAGINSGGELSASEGVKLLADKVVQIKVLLNSNYGPGGIGRFVPDEPKPMCDQGYGHGGAWCGPHVECWLDPRPKSERGQQ